MDALELRQAVDILGGEDKVFGFIYDNAGRTIFDSTKPFSLSMIEGEFLKTSAVSLEGIEFVELKPIENIQSIIGVKDSKDRDLMDKHYFRA